jgi:hypothetical protein
MSSSFTRVEKKKVLLKIIKSFVEGAQNIRRRRNKLSSFVSGTICIIFNEGTFQRWQLEISQDPKTNLLSHKQFKGVFFSYFFLCLSLFFIFFSV